MKFGYTEDEIALMQFNAELEALSVDVPDRGCATVSDGQNVLSAKFSDDFRLVSIAWVKVGDANQFATFTIRTGLLAQFITAIGDAAEATNAHAE